jgi:hypothetical protein
MLHVCVKDSMWRKIWKICKFFYKLNKPLAEKRMHELACLSTWPDRRVKRPGTEPGAAAMVRTSGSTRLLVVMGSVSLCAARACTRGVDASRLRSKSQSQTQQPGTATQPIIQFHYYSYTPRRQHTPCHLKQASERKRERTTTIRGIYFGRRLYGEYTFSSVISQFRFVCFYYKLEPFFFCFLH